MLTHLLVDGGTLLLVLRHVLDLALLLLHHVALLARHVLSHGRALLLVHSLTLLLLITKKTKQ